jgi:hypothetical protein
MKFKQLRESIKGDEMNPPPMLVLRRRGYRLFPDGRRVALYTNDQYKLVFTIPYEDKNKKTDYTTINSVNPY